jgi:hypothetical protein
MNLFSSYFGGLRKRRAVFFLPMFFLLFFLLWAEAKPKPKRARLEPRKGGYFGLNLDWGTDTPKDAASRFGFKPKVLVRFFEFPLNEEDLGRLDETFRLVKQQRAMLLITLEPWGGLEVVTEEAAANFADVLRRGRVKTYVRFAHEMNGSWYPWSQSPTNYKSAFCVLAKAIHQHARNAAMIWAPNYGGGYPFVGGAYQAQPDSPYIPVLDTNKNGVLDSYDDPYSPYYPGDDVVDWVGMTLYHWGDAYPWGENEIPEANKFAEQITGTYNGLGGDQRMVPDFIQEYSIDRSKPMAIPETSALFVPALGPAWMEKEIKEAWWNQIFSVESRERFPSIRMINWFEWKKEESELDFEIVDWRVSHDPEILDAFLSVLRNANLNVKIKKRKNP